MLALVVVTCYLLESCFLNCIFIILAQNSLYTFFLPPRQYFFTAQAQCFITFKRHMNSLSPIVNEPSGEIHLT